MLYINAFVSTSSTNRWKAFFQKSFFNYCPKKERKIFRRIVRCEYSSETQIAMYSESVFELTIIFFNNIGVGFMHARRGRPMC